jgi:hypothetical protein
MTAHLRSYSTVLRREREDAALACLLVCLRCGALCIVHDKQHAHVVSACRRVSCGLRRHCVYATTHYYLLETPTRYPARPATARHFCRLLLRPANGERQTRDNGSLVSCLLTAGLVWPLRKLYFTLYLCMIQ